MTRELEANKARKNILDMVHTSIFFGNAGEGRVSFCRRYLLLVEVASNKTMANLKRFSGSKTHHGTQATMCTRLEASPGFG